MYSNLLAKGILLRFSLMKFDSRMLALSPNFLVFYTCVHFSGAAVGFRLDSLLKLSDIRARNNRMTLMHYLCKV